MKMLSAEKDWSDEISKIIQFQDESSFRLIFKHFYGALVSFATSVTANNELSEDLVSDLMLKVWIQPENLKNVQNLKTFLYVSVKNRCLNELERNKRHTNYLNNLQTYPLNSISPEDEYQVKELSHNIQHAIQQLSPKTKMVYILLRDNDCSYAEVAEILSISPKTVDRHLQIALKKLRDSIKNYLL
ncbi:RNA polymerase sigma-70 factor [Sphingobacterium sp. HJSM2_6]|uniref:RNA polymerase sigma-70 factor n=1 Tax=Sphingobacterium sp. HJSM2_6 TaxID=3366264 RepID=UPI003BEB74FC